MYSFFIRRKITYAIISAVQIFLVLCTSSHTAAQEKGEILHHRINISLSYVPVKRVLKEMGKQTGYTFSYSSDLVKSDSPVTVKYKDIPLEDALHQLFGDRLHTVRVSGKQIFLQLIAGKDKGRIIGKIFTSDGKPIGGASVQFQDTNTGTITNDDGSYELQAPEGTYSLTVSYTGFAVQTKSIAVKGKRSTNADFILEENGNQLKDVAVKSIDFDRSNRMEVQQLKQSGFSVNAIDLRQYSNMSLDLNQVLARTTGVIVRQSGGLGSDYQFYINGLTGNHIRFFLDGIPLENLGSTFNLNNIPVNFAKRIEVYKGVVPTELGSDALGGAVNIITDQNIHKFIDASYSYGSFNTHRASVNTRFINPKTGLMINFNGFYNYSDNDYWMRNNPKYNVLLEVTEDGQYVEKDKVRRFYDRYKSGMGNFEIGYTNRKWADYATVGVNVSGNNKENQTGATINAVYGGFYTTDKNIMPELRYKKRNFLVKGLDQYLDATYSFDKSWTHDTAKYEYDWSGKWIEPLGVHDQTDMEYTLKTLQIKDNWNYRLDKHSSFSLNYTLDRSSRKSFDHLLPADNSQNLILPNTVVKHIAGLSYQGNFLHDKLITTLMVKYYGLGISQDSLKLIETTDKEGGVYDVIPGTHTMEFHSYMSYAATARYMLAEDIGIKASYEQGYRLPMLAELFGDGQTVRDNRDLSPERSNNYNAGFFYKWTGGKHRIDVEGNFYFRNAKDYIYNEPISAYYSQYKNVGKVQIKGVDGEATYTYGQLLHLTANISYQNAIDNNKYDGDATSGTESITYKARIPNMPWMYGNLDFGIGKNDLLGKKTRIEFDWHTQYTHWFYLSWSNLGAKDTKNIIPTQWIHSPAITYSWESGKYNVSFQSLNVTNALAYDNFRLQKPGRSFEVKFRVFFM